MTPDNQPRPALAFLATFLALPFLIATSAAAMSAEERAADYPTEGDWLFLFDGSDLEGWKASEVPGVFTITEQKELRVDGGRSHLFWMGTETIPAEFKDFELSLQVMTTENANSGVFFHSQYQETGWPKHGYEVQVNTTHKDKRKTGSIYGVQNIEYDAPSVDGEWFDLLIRVENRTVTVTINGEVVNEYTEPLDLELSENFPHRHLGAGTVAIQGHDPESVTLFKNIKIRLL